MTMRKYKVSMQVPLGERKGWLVLRETDGRIEGELSILGHTEPFVGTLTADGWCRLHGEITSAMHTIPYKAVGTITGRSLCMTLSVESGRQFYITGEEETDSSYGKAL